MNLQPFSLVTSTLWWSYLWGELYEFTAIYPCNISIVIVLSLGRSTVAFITMTIVFHTVSWNFTLLHLFPIWMIPKHKSTERMINKYIAVANWA